LNTSERAELEQQAAALLELERRKRDFPLFFYRPIDKIRPFHTSRRPIRLLGGGNRSGKSHSGAAETAAYLLGYRPWVLREMGLPQPTEPWKRPASLPDEALCFTAAGIRVQIPNTILCLTGLPAKRGIGETIAPKLRELLGPLIADEKMGHAGVPAEMTLKNGSRVVFSSDEQRGLSHEGTSYHAVHVDEPIKRSSFTALRRGSVDFSAPMWLTFTPLGMNAGWMFRDLYSPGLREDQDRIQVTTLSIYDNPYLPAEAVADFANDPTLDSSEKEARLYGRFKHLVDRIYPNLDSEVHVVPGFVPPDNWYTVQIVDPHAVRPWFIAYGAIDPRGEGYLFREWPPGEFHRIRRDVKSYDEYLELFLKLEKDLRVSHRLIDPNFGPRTDVDRRTGLQIQSIVSYFAARGVYFNHKLNDDLLYGEGQVRRLLSYDTTQPLAVTNRPKLYFTDDCPNLIAAMSFYTAKPRPGTDGYVDENARDETYKDGADIVRYFAVSDLMKLAAVEDSWGGYGFDTDDSYPSTDGYQE
jgi:hypothetical protein